MVDLSALLLAVLILIVVLRVRVARRLALARCCLRRVFCFIILVAVIEVAGLAICRWGDRGHVGHWAVSIECWRAGWKAKATTLEKTSG